TEAISSCLDNMVVTRIYSMKMAKTMINKVRGHEKTFWVGQPKANAVRRSSQRCNVVYIVTAKHQVLLPPTKPASQEPGTAIQANEATSSQDMDGFNVYVIGEKELEEHICVKEAKSVCRGSHHQVSVQRKPSSSQCAEED
ncbi:hypothetical protein STEG23_023819, partial [Scotinomys teguina]